MQPITALLFGALAGIPARFAAGRLIADRVEAPLSGMLLNGRFSLAVWAGGSGLGWCLIALCMKNASFAELIFPLAIFELVLCLSAVDSLIKKIPNELLISLILVFLASRLTAGGFAGFQDNLIGAAVATVVFLIPSRLGMNVGWGDVKYAFVIGLCFGILNFLQTMLVMAAGLGVYALVLTVTKKGGLKTKAPMGPYLSLGVVTTLLFPVLQRI